MRLFAGYTYPLRSYTLLYMLYVTQYIDENVTITGTGYSDPPLSW